MYKINMWYTISTLLKQGRSMRSIAKELGISRVTVKRIKKQIDSDGAVTEPKIIKQKKLDAYEDFVKQEIEKGKTAVLIKEKLMEKFNFSVSYPTVARFILNFKKSEVYVPLISKPGEEGQVDFGYFGRFLKNGKFVKVWVFSMVLSYSRYSYYQLVTDQKVETFINCHIHAFEFFSGVPQTVKIDNLKAGVITPSFFEPTIQYQYNEFLEHYGSAPITARIRRGQDKGKVESGIKYVKNNFLKSVEHQDYEQLQKDLREWLAIKCNVRIHGTTKKIPEEIFNRDEKKQLLKLPSARYEIFKVEQRKVNKFAHISFKNNYYSVPAEYVDQKITIKSTQTLLKIFCELEQIALHPVSNKIGEYITNQDHRPLYKAKKTKQDYIEKTQIIGAYAEEFLKKLFIEKPYHWQNLIKVIFDLKKTYTDDIINKACKRALNYNALSYKSVKNICENKLYDKPYEETSVKEEKGFVHDLKLYDKLSLN